MHDLLALYRAALRSGDRALAAALSRALRSDRRLTARADRELQELPRGPACWSARGAQVIARVLRRIADAVA
ncbi:MAG TPA: hypothetical protein VK307_02710 [Thermoleophilaceae bacterium]|nr:hypothetical protein [Thermoleophilaceae bacterium]